MSIIHFPVYFSDPLPFIDQLIFFVRLIFFVYFIHLSYPVFFLIQFPILLLFFHILSLPSFQSIHISNIYLKQFFSLFFNILVSHNIPYNNQMYIYMDQSINIYWSFLVIYIQDIVFQLFFNRI